MVRSGRSRAVAISAGSSAARSVAWSAARRAGPSTRWSTAVARSSIRAITPRAGRALTVFLVAFATDDNATTANHLPIHARDHARRVCLGHFDQGVTLPQVDLADAIS